MSSALDLVVWAEALQDSVIISPEQLKTISKPYNNNREHQSALGVVQWEEDRMIKRSHHGSTGNYECIVNIDLQTKMTIAIVTNRKNKNLDEIVEKAIKII